ncbi:MAG TPA: hypothetical protein VKR58_06385 [Aquella sp.]|nr:hypothetical protein [Aquella sp.]
MTVNKLIEVLNKVEDKNLPITLVTLEGDLVMDYTIEMVAKSIGTISNYEEIILTPISNRWAFPLQDLEIIWEED